MEKDKRLIRSASVSSVGKFLDRYFSGPYKSLKETKARSLEKTSSQKQIVLPRLREQTGKIKTEEGTSNKPRSRKAKQLQIEGKIQKEISCLRYGSSKPRLQIEPRRRSLEPEKQRRQVPESKIERAVPIKCWKDLKKAAPSSGYLYIDCHSEPQQISTQERKITISSDWVLITEPSEQQIYKISDYADILRNYESLNKITFFRCFKQLKAFRKWKRLCQENLFKSKMLQLQEKLKGAYRDVYSDVANFLEKIRKFKFIGASQSTDISLNEFSDYLFNGSLKIIEEIHQDLFPACVSAFFRPIKESMVRAQYREEERKKFKEEMKFQKEFIINYMSCQDEIIQIKLQQRLKKLRYQSSTGGQEEYSYIKSTAFINQFISFFKVLKKCLYIFNQFNIKWIDGLLSEILSKIQDTLKVWINQKPKFVSIMSSFTKNKPDKYEYYSANLGIRDVQLIAYICELNQDKKIVFQLQKDTVISLYQQYSEYLMSNLSFQKMLQSYAFEKYSIRPQCFAQNISKHAEIELLMEMTKTNDCYNSGQIVRQLSLKQKFRAELRSLVNNNFEEVQSVIESYNTFIQDVYQGVQVSKMSKIPSETYNYFQKTKSKLLYLPKKVDVGIFSLDFQGVHQFLLLQIGFMQTQVYINVPSDFKALFDDVKSFLSRTYSGVSNSLWTIDDILKSYKIYQAYQQYKLSSNLHSDLKRLKGYLDVISVKCNSKYQQSFNMYLQVKGLKDRIDIKNNIFSEKLPKRLILLKGTIDKLKESIWSSLLEEQAFLTAIGKEEIDIALKLTRIVECRERLKEVKSNMNKLQEISKLQDRYFIDQDLTVNSHSYEKMQSDSKLLIDYLQKYMSFKETIANLHPIKIANIDTREYLTVLLANTKQINEDYLLLITYQWTIKEILKNYEEWKKYLSTIQDLCCLSTEDLQGIPLFHQLLRHKKFTEISLADCINMDICTIYHQIYHLKMTKLKKSQLATAFEDIKELLEQKPFKISSYKIDGETKKKEKIRSSKGFSSKSLSSRNILKLKESVVFEFEGIAAAEKSIEQTKNHIVSLAGSIYLKESRLDISVTADELEKILSIFGLFREVQLGYNQIMEYQYFGDLQLDTEGTFQLSNMLINEENMNFFQKYKGLKQVIGEQWMKTVYLLEKKSVRVVITVYEQTRSTLQSIKTKMRKLKGLVFELIDKISKEIYLLKLLDTSTVLYIIRNPDYYFQLFYPIKQIDRNEKTIKIVTNYDQILELPSKDRHKDNISEFISLEGDISETLRQEINSHYEKKPIDNLLNYMNQQLPLQVIYALDQLYLNECYLSTDKSSSIIMKNLDGEIKLICRNGLKQGLGAGKVNYCIALSSQLLQSRIELRSRVDNSQNDLHFRSILTFQLFESAICLKNFNTRYICSYQLVDHTHLSFIFPFCEKALVKICSHVNLQESMVIEQPELVQNIAARMMTIFFKVALSKQTIGKVLSVCVQRFPIFVLGMVANLNVELSYVYEQLNRIERIGTEQSGDKRAGMLPSIFILPAAGQDLQISQTLKLRFRVINAVTPCPKVILDTKMLMNDFLIEKGLFLDIVFVIRSFLIESRAKNIRITLHELTKMCEYVIERLRECETKKMSEDSILTLLFQDYFKTLNIKFEDDILRHVRDKDRAEFRRTTNYDLVQNIIRGNQKEVKSKEDNKIMMNYLMKQYLKMKTSFKEYCAGLNLTCKNFMGCLNELFELSFSYEHRPIGVIGACGVGKSLLLSLFHSYLSKYLGECNISWRYCKVELFNAAMGGLLTEKELGLYSMAGQEQERKQWWIVFEDFIPESNYSLLEYVFKEQQNEEDLQLFFSITNETRSLGQFLAKKQEITQRAKKMHGKYFCFQLSELKQMAPSYVSMMAKIYLSDESIDLQALYELSLNSFLKKIAVNSITQDVLYKAIVQNFKELMPYLLRLINDLVNIKAKSLDWIVTLTPKTALRRIFLYFSSFFESDGKKRIQIFYQRPDSLQMLGKLFTYCVFVTLQNFVAGQFHFQLEKMVRSSYSLFTSEEAKDQFLSKLVVFSSRQIEFVQFQRDENAFDRSISLYHSDIIETDEIKLVTEKYLQHLSEGKVSLLILGGKQSGKTTLIRCFLSKDNDRRLRVSGRNQINSFHELTKLMNSCKQKPRSDVFKRMTQFFVFVDDVSAESHLTKAEVYLKYIESHRCFIGNNELVESPQISSILQRRSLSEQLKNKLWYTYIINFQPPNTYYPSIFTQLIKGKLDEMTSQLGQKSFTFSYLSTFVQNAIKAMNYCDSHFKRGLQSWTYDFSMTHLKQMFDDLMRYYSYQKNPKQNDFLVYASNFICSKNKKRLSTQRQIQELSNHISFNMVSLKCLEDAEKFHEKKCLLLKNGIQTENIMGKKALVKILMTDDIINFASELQMAFEVYGCVLVNKANVLFNFSIVSVAANMIGYPIRELLYCKNQSKFFNQIQKIIESKKKQGRTVMYYLSLEEGLNNPEVIRYIADYLKQQETKCDQETSPSLQHPCKFIIEYSTNHFQYITSFLDSDIIQRCFVLHFKEEKRFEPYQVAAKVIENKKMVATVEPGLVDGISRYFIRFFDELRNIETPKNLEKQLFRLNYLFSKQNFVLFLSYLFDIYVVLIKKIQNKKRMLEVSLSELSFMFKEYKQLKKLNNNLYREESTLREMIISDKDQLKRFRKEYQSAKNENIIEKIQKNERQMELLQRQIDQIHSSQKIWERIYKNAQMSISRTEFAELKYLFLTNYSSELELFELIAYLTGERTDLASLKRCFSDINIVTKLKQIEIASLPIETLEYLRQRLDVINKRDKLSCSRNILEWANLGCRLGLHRIEKESRISSLNGRIEQLKALNISIRQKSNINELEKQILQFQKRISTNNSSLTIVQLKFKKTAEEMAEFESEFDALIHFETFCLQQLDTLKQLIKKLESYCFLEAIEFSVLNSLEGPAKKKMKEIALAKLRKLFGVIANEEQCLYFKLLQQSGEEKVSSKWLIRPKNYLSLQKKKLLNNLNKYLLEENPPLAIIDRRFVLSLDTIKNNALTINLQDEMETSRELNFEQYSLIVIESNSWQILIKQSSSQFQSFGHYHIVKYKQTRLSIPTDIPLIVVFRGWGSDELVFNFKVIDLQLSGSDFEQMIEYFLCQQKNLPDNREQLFEKRVLAENSFMSIVYYLCKKTQDFSLKSKNLIKNLTLMIQQLNKQLNMIKHIIKSNEYQQLEQKKDAKLCRIISQLFLLSIYYFPSYEQTSIYFRNILQHSFQYLKLEGSKVDSTNVINSVIEFLTEGLANKSAFIYLYYARIYAVEEGIATKLESENLTFVSIPSEQLQRNLKELKQEVSLMRYLQYGSIQLQRIYSKILKLGVKNQSQINQAIEGENISFFNKLILKKVLIPRLFQNEIDCLVKGVQVQVGVKYMTFLKRMQIKHNLFCVCDASYWVSKLNFPENSKFASLAELIKRRKVNKEERLHLSKGLWIVFDDLDSHQGSMGVQEILQVLSGVKQQVNLILLLKKFPSAKYQQYFKYISFKRLIYIFEIKQLVKVSQGYYSATFKKITKLKNELLASKLFNQRVINSQLYEQLRGQITSKSDYTNDQILMQIEWCYFQWDPVFVAINQSLSQILSLIEVNPALLKQYARTDNFLGQVQSVLKKPFEKEMKLCDMMELQKMIKDEGALFEVSLNKVPKSFRIQIFYKELKFKKKRIDSFLDTILQAGKIVRGEIELTVEVVQELRVLLKNFKLSPFYDALMSMMRWKKQESNKELLNISEIESQLHLYLLFQYSYYVFHQMPQANSSIKAQPTPQSTQLIHEENSDDELDQICEGVQNQSIVDEKEGENQSMESIAIIPGPANLQTEEKMLSQPFIKRNRMYSNVVPHRRLSLLEDIGRPNSLGKQLIKTTFMGHQYIYQRKVVRIKPLTVKEKKKVDKGSFKTIGLLQNKYLLKIVQWQMLKDKPDSSPFLLNKLKNVKQKSSFASSTHSRLKIE